MEPSGDVFTPAKAPAPRVSAPADPAFAFPTEQPLKISSEQLSSGTGSLAAAAGVDLTKLEEETAYGVTAAAAAEPVVVAAPPAVGLPSSPWPVRLLSTIAEAQPPRAIIGLPSGEERVVSPGSILADEGLVVMSITADRVQLARIEAAGDHARISPMEITAQFPR